MSEIPKTLLLIDGNYYLYRSFFAIPIRDLKSPNGHPANAVFGFSRAVRKMLADVQPTHGAVLWDAGLPARRMALQPDYKQQRPPKPPELKAQEEPIQRMCSYQGLRSLSMESAEADDLIASYAKAAPNETKVVIATVDKDIYQLVSPNVRIYSTTKADFPVPPPAEVAKFILLGPEEVEKKWGIPPSSIGDVLSLTGDSADNIPGVRGIGLKTAVKLIQEFGSIEHLLQNLDRVAKVSLSEKLIAGIPILQSNREMIRLDDHLPLSASWADLRIVTDRPALIDFFQDFGFKSLLKDLTQEATALEECDLFSQGTCENPSLEAEKTQQGELFS